MKNIIFIIVTLFSTTLNAQVDTLIGMVNGELIKIHLSDAGISDHIVVADFPAGYDPFRITWCPPSNCYYGLARVGGTVETSLIRITASGEYTVLGLITVPGETVGFMESISFNRQDEKVYVSASLNGIPPADYSSETILRIDTTALTGEVVGVIDDGTFPESDGDHITFDDAGNLYYYDGIPGSTLSFYEHDFTFASPAELIYTSGYYPSSDLTVRDDILYFSGDRVLRQIDLATNTYSEVGTMFTAADYDGALLRGLTWMPTCDTDDPDFTYVETVFCTADAPAAPVAIVTAGGSFSASPVGLAVDPVTGEIDPSLSVEGTYELTYYLDGDCPSDSTKTIVITGLPTVDPVTDLNYCSDDLSVAINFTGSTGATFDWVNDNTSIGIEGAGTGSVPSFTTAIVASNEVGVFSVTPTIGTCIGETVSFEFEVNPLPTVDFLADLLTGCEPLEVTFTETTAPIGGTCFWEFGDGGTSTDCGPLNYIFDNPGDFDVRLVYTDPNGCTNEMVKPNYIEVNPLPEVSFTSSTSTITESNSLVSFFNTSVNAETYTWDFGDGSGLDNTDSPFHNFGNGNSFEVMLIGQNGGVNCADTAYATITYQDEILIYVPNAFTPDGDEFNNSFVPVVASGVDPYDYHMSIYNRWGELIFESYDLTIGWNGTYGRTGGLVQQGIYIWVIEFGELNGTDERHTLTGHVSIIE